MSVDGEDLPVFQCDQCTEIRKVFGEPFEVAVTFCVDSHGKVIAVDDGVEDQH